MGVLGEQPAVRPRLLDRTAYGPGDLVSKVVADLQYVTGEQQFAVTAGPVPPLKGNVQLVLIAGYWGEGSQREVATPPTNVSIVAGTAFARSRRRWPR